jgi:hypothetical protein
MDSLAVRGFSHSAQDVSQHLMAEERKYPKMDFLIFDSIWISISVIDIVFVRHVGLVLSLFRKTESRESPQSVVPCFRITRGHDKPFVNRNVLGIQIRMRIQNEESGFHKPTVVD